MVLTARFVARAEIVTDDRGMSLTVPHAPLSTLLGSKKSHREGRQASKVYHTRRRTTDGRSRERGDSVRRLSGARQLQSGQAVTVVE